jgi:hypothetical protein
MFQAPPAKTPTFGLVCHIRHVAVSIGRGQPTPAEIAFILYRINTVPNAAIKIAHHHCKP